MKIVENYLKIEKGAKNRTVIHHYVIYVCVGLEICTLSRLPYGNHYTGDGMVCGCGGEEKPSL
jgi:hypothetical protein